MNTKKIFIGTLAISALFTAGLTVKADDTSPVVSTSSNGDVTLSVPDAADKVITDTDDHVAYQVNDAVTIDSSDGADLMAPVTVDSQITSDDGTETTGVTTYAADLNQAVVVEDNDFDSTNLGAAVLGEVFGTKAFAQDYHTSTSGTDWTGSLKLKLTVYWSENSSGVERKVTEVKGSYSCVDPSTQLKASSVIIGNQGIKGASQIVTHSLGTKNNWDIKTGYGYVFYLHASSGGATYNATIGRSTSGKTWKFSFSDTIWNNI